MEYAVQFQINIFAIAIIIVLYAIMRMRSRVESYSKSLLKVIMLTGAIAIVMEPLTWIFDSKQFPGAYFLEYSTNFLLFLLGPVLGGVMLSYVDYHLFKDPARIKKRMYYQGASILTFFVLIINIFYPVYFYIDPVRNSFSSGDFKDLHYVVLGSFYLYMLFFVLKNRRRTHPYVVLLFIGFFLLPVIGMIVQLFDSKLYFSWTTVVLSVLASYTFLESTTTEEDFLTKLYNRQSYESYLKYLIEGNRRFSVMLMDLNHFKEINDQYGHQRGDEVLVAFGQILKKTCRKSAFVCRLGGDEFVIVIENDQAHSEKIINDIKQTLGRSEDPLLQQLTFSYGYHHYQNSMTMDELYAIVDQKMYQFKRAMKTV
ncbi:GGDEF domain-containing protein [Jeotgalibacillus aurantiacus]|uniref:GGDEF domain-containing protein n=1 Tax=Jeotgalibacillus aurantiacus TaxID=2763266 RepID=UPI001D09F6FA|nr:GGDEF domain-containing protein [Jeotgalibacillus aurantiacus]